MIIISIIILTAIIFAFLTFLIVILSNTNSILKKTIAQQKKLIEVQRSTIDLKEGTIQNYKKALKGGICIITNEQKN
jgi:cell division protein FtsB